MLIPKGEKVEIRKNCKVADLLDELSNSAFTGYVELYYKSGELSKGQLLIRNGNIVAGSVEKIVSKKEILGDKVLDELKKIESCVAEVYVLEDEKVEKALNWNKNALISPEPRIIVASEAKRSKTETTVDLTNYREKEIAAPDRKKILEKYGIRDPTPEEIDALIKNAFDEVPLEMKSEEVISEVRRVIEDRFGKLSRKLLEIVDECKTVDELVKNFEVLENEAKKLSLFIPRKKIDETLEEIRQIIGS